MLIQLFFVAFVFVCAAYSVPNVDGNDHKLSLEILLSPSSAGTGRLTEQKECGVAAKNGIFPWHATIYKSDFQTFEYECAGTLISSNRILTAASCVSTQGLAYDPDILIAFLAKNNLKRWIGPIQISRINQILLHPKFDHTNYEYDVAILKLEVPVALNDLVRPACLYKGEDSISTLIGQEGTMTGWTYDANEYTSENIGLIKMVIVPNDECRLTSLDKSATFTRIGQTETLFCGSFRKSNVCRGDVGGGLYFQENGKWIIRGVSSINIGDEGEVICDSKHFGTFSDLVGVTTWIRDNL